VLELVAAVAIDRSWGFLDDVNRRRFGGPVNSVVHDLGEFSIDLMTGLRLIVDQQRGAVLRSNLIGRFVPQAVVERVLMEHAA